MGLLQQLTVWAVTLTCQQFCLQGTEYDCNKKICVWVLSGLCDFGAKQMKARECVYYRAVSYKADKRKRESIEDKSVVSSP